MPVVVVEIDEVDGGNPADLVQGNVIVSDVGGGDAEVFPEPGVLGSLEAESGEAVKTGGVPSVTAPPDENAESAERQNLSDNAPPSLGAGPTPNMPFSVWRIIPCSGVI